MRLKSATKLQSDIFYLERIDKVACKNPTDFRGNAKLRLAFQKFYYNILISLAL
jgi:hypothetical protein